MASLFERLRNVWDDHLETVEPPPAPTPTREYHRALTDVRDKLLGDALAIKHELDVAEYTYKFSPLRNAVLHEYGVLDTLNTAFRHLSELDPTIRTQIKDTDLLPGLGRPPVPQKQAQHTAENSHENVAEDTERSATFGMSSQANILMPSGNLGISEREHYFNITPTPEGYAVHLSRTNQYIDNGVTVMTREIPTGGPSDFGPFTTKDEAREFVADYIADYRGAEREHIKAGIEYQAAQDQREHTAEAGI